MYRKVYIITKKIDNLITCNICYLTLITNMASTNTQSKIKIITEYCNVFRIIKYEYDDGCMYKFTCCKKNMMITSPRGYEIMRVKFNDFQIDIGNSDDIYDALLEYIRCQIIDKMIGPTGLFKLIDKYNEKQLIIDVSEILRKKLDV